MPPLGRIFRICPEAKRMYFTIREYGGRALVLKQKAKWPAQVVRVNWRKTLNLNHVPLDLVDSGWTASRERSCQSLVLISAMLVGKEKPANGTRSVVLIGWPVNYRSTRELGGGCRMRWDQSSIWWMPWRWHGFSLWPFTHSQQWRLSEELIQPREAKEQRNVLSPYSSHEAKKNILEKWEI